jgi:hypothetical protein
MSIVREIARAVRIAMADWPTTFRLCLLLLATGTAAGMFLVVYSVVSAMLPAHGG